MGGEEKKSTLLEDIETLHRDLKELQSVKAYVQVVEYALKLRFAKFVEFVTKPDELKKKTVKQPSNRCELQTRSLPRWQSTKHSRTSLLP
jgi:hypothetical protein